MTGRERKEFIQAIGKQHAENRREYVARKLARDPSAEIYWGIMIGIELTVNAMGIMPNLAADLIFLREKECYGNAL